MFRAVAILIAFGVAPLWAGPVQVELLEGQYKERTWDVAQGKVTTRWDEPAFGFTRLPLQYSPKGIALDRTPLSVLRATATLTLPNGRYQLLLRSRNAARLFVDDQLVVENPFPRPSTDGHHPLTVFPALTANVRPFAVGDLEKRADWLADGQSHTFRLELTVGGAKGLRPDLGQTAVAIAAPGKDFVLLNSSVPFSAAGWADYAAERTLALRQLDDANRQSASAAERAYWTERHAQARAYWAKQPPVPVPTATTLPVQSVVDQFLNVRLAGKTLAPLTNDETFLRRVYLDTVGVVPTPAELSAFSADHSADKRARVIGQLLADPRWADHWMGYWQDVLAENPGLLKPTLNNTGPFRFWLHAALRDRLSFDRVVTELVRMDGSFVQGGPAGFAIAAENDLPMAAKAQTVAKAFLAIDLTCARCHDAPGKGGFKQEQLFSLAALLGQKSFKVPASSTVKVPIGGRKPNVKSTLKIGQEVKPDWQFDDLANDRLPAGLVREPNHPRERVAAILTNYQNERFAQVLVNRLWKRLLGTGLVEPVENWADAAPSQPELLQYLGREFITHDYRIEHIAGLILRSHAYQRQVVPQDLGNVPLFASPARRRLSAEQLVDSLFAIAGKEFDCEELTFDPEARQPIKQCLNFGVPKRAWEFVGLANERDRPALALPRAQMIVDVLAAYGWRESRSTSQTLREEVATPLQPMVLANGLTHTRIARLCDQSAFTALALREQPVAQLVDELFARVLTRAPSAEERSAYIELLTPGYAERKTGQSALPREFRAALVTWSNHLSAGATTQVLKEEQAARQGDRPTPQLAADWRGRLEDAVWVLLNTPELLFVP
jgi:hypothetical protein